MTRANEEIRRMIGFYGIRQWELAEALGVREETVSRWMRTELDPDKKDRVIRAINQISVASHG